MRGLGIAASSGHSHVVASRQVRAVVRPWCDLCARESGVAEIQATWRRTPIEILLTVRTRFREPMARASS